MAKKTDEEVREVIDNFKAAKDLKVEMNQELQDFGRKKLKEGLKKLTERQQGLFMQMYAFGSREKSIEIIVDNMHDEQIDWAMTQVQNTIDKNIKLSYT